MKQIVRNAKGFTLVELMIVVAIIGILAAIAIPQFTAYRIRGFNSAAISDIRNLATAEAGLFTSAQSFGITQANIAVANPQVWPNVAGGPGQVCTGPIAAAAQMHALAILPQIVGAVSTGTRIGVSNGVTVIANTEALAAAPAGPVRAASYILGAKHTNGDTFYAQDSDIEAIYQIQDGRPTAITTPLVVADVPASVAGANDLLGVAGGSGAGTWAAR